MNISSATDFFNSIVKPTVNEFLADPEDLRLGILAAITLHHMEDHYIQERKENK